MTECIWNTFLTNRSGISNKNTKDMRKKYDEVIVAWDFFDRIIEIWNMV